MSTNESDVNKKDGVKKANEYLPRRKKAVEPERLFDEFWREGELALLFGAAGTGKSVIAMQVADAIARGTPLSGFVMPKRRRKVLYVDLGLTGTQFGVRYGRYTFSENLFRDKPGPEDDLFTWIKEAVSAKGLRAVVIDDLSAVKRTYDGIRENLVLMRRLKRLCEKADISVLAVSDAAEPRENWATESDLGRSVILCRVADSVFSIGRMPGQDMRSRLIQSRARTPKIFWRPANAPIGSIKQLTSGLIGFEFDGRFAPVVDEARRERICDVYWRHEGGSSFRVIADELGISKTTAQRLCRMWTPAMGGKPVMVVDEPDEEEEDESGISDIADIWLSEERGQSEPTEGPADEDREPSIFDLEKGFDSNWNEIFIEEREGYTGKPKIWYQRDRDGAVKRFERRLYGIQVEHLRAGEFV
jgi:KaiC/GvpD/RAD55 family RecA-like ATPase